MPSIKSSLFLKLWSEYRQFVFHHLSLGNLAVRCILLAVVLYQGTYFVADSGHYIAAAEQVCHGFWGGEPMKSPLLLWFLCLLSPDISRQFPTSSQFFLPLLILNLLVWAGGVLIFKRTQKPFVAFFWFFDPVLLVYSFFVMTDVLFAVFLLFGIFSLKDYLKNPTAKKAGLLGIFLALCSLTRPNGLYLSALTFFFLMFFHLYQQKKASSLILGVFAAYLLLLSPRLYWNKTQNHFFGLNTQGGEWIKTIAAISEFAPQGYDFINAEKKWNDAYPKSTKEEAVQSLFNRNFKSWSYYTALGMARVFFGHVNVEWSYLFTKKSPVGPGLTKPREPRADSFIETKLGTALWFAGFVLVTCYCLFVYGMVFKNLNFKDPFVWWCLLGMLLMAFLPLVFGDARFRCGVWPFVLSLWCHSLEKGRMWFQPK